MGDEWEVKEVNLRKMLDQLFDKCSTLKLCAREVATELRKRADMLSPPNAQCKPPYMNYESGERP